MTFRFEIKKYSVNYVDVDGNLTHTDTEFHEYEGRIRPGDDRHPRAMDNFGAQSSAAYDGEQPQNS